MFCLWSVVPPVAQWELWQQGDKVPLSSLPPSLFLSLLSFYSVSLLFSAAEDTERIWQIWDLKALLIGHEEQGWPAEGGKAGRNRGGRSRRKDHLCPFHTGTEIHLHPLKSGSLKSPRRQAGLFVVLFFIHLTAFSWFVICVFWGELNHMICERAYVFVKCNYSCKSSGTVITIARLTEM